MTTVYGEAKESYFEEVWSVGSCLNFLSLRIRMLLSKNKKNVTFPLGRPSLIWVSSPTKKKKEGQVFSSFNVFSMPLTQNIQYANVASFGCTSGIPPLYLDVWTHVTHFLLPDLESANSLRNLGFIQQEMVFQDLNLGIRHAICYWAGFHTSLTFSDQSRRSIFKIKYLVSSSCCF